MGRYWRIYRTFFKSSFARELEFKANFIAKILQNATWIAFFVVIILVVYSRTDSIAGWKRGDTMLLASSLFLMTSFSGAFFFSLTEIPTQVRMGTLDFIVTKPIDNQFWISTRRFNFDQIGTLIAGIGMLVYGAIESKIAASPMQWGAFGLLLVCSLVIFYSFNLALMTTGIWLVKVDNLWVLSESVTGVARYPLDIYSQGLQRFLTFVVPLGFLATVPTRQLVEGFDGTMLLVGIAWAAASFVGSRVFWRFALKHYSSASS